MQLSLLILRISQLISFSISRGGENFQPGVKASPKLT